MVKNFDRLFKRRALEWCGTGHHFFHAVPGESCDIAGPRHPVDDEHVVAYVDVDAVRAKHPVYFAQ